MIAIHQNKIKDIQKKFEKEIEKQRGKAFNKLKKINKNQFSRVEKDYLIKIINLFKTKTIIYADPSEINSKIADLGIAPPNSRFYKNGKSKKQLKKFIIEALGYKSLRSSFYPKYFNEIGIKACVYCNSQLTIVAKKAKESYSAKFDVDHYHSKDEFPFLAICLFNLYPVCASCNRLKSNNVIKFELYSDKPSKTKKSDYKFKLEPYSKAKYLTTKDAKDISFQFTPKNSDLNETFHVEGIYQTQKDIIEELIIKSQIYNPSYTNLLKESFKKLSLHPKLFKRFVVGNYTEEKDIHKRPMSKFMQDIAKDLGLID